MGDYHYPAWGEVIGFAISLSSMLWVPGRILHMFPIIWLQPPLSGYAIYYLLSTPGTWVEVLRQGVTPVIKPRKEAAKAEERTFLTNKQFSDLEMNLEDDSVNTCDAQEYSFVVKSDSQWIFHNLIFKWNRDLETEEKEKLTLLNFCKTIFLCMYKFVFSITIVHYVSLLISFIYFLVFLVFLPCVPTLQFIKIIYL